ncbi:MAG TPA: hypothetical protein VN924_02015 [Bryobacteraceae bacterium]|nr:hypothetical protein [Bryobacteraceae bacterium]
MKPLPCASAGFGEALLSFEDQMTTTTGAHPEQESDIVARFLGLVLNARVERTASRIGTLNVPAVPDTRRQYPQFFGTADVSVLSDYTDRLLSLPLGVCRQFLRACHTYSFSLGFIPADPAFAFFLLVVAAECLSSQTAVIPASEAPTQKSCERFCQFLARFGTPQPDLADAVLLGLLKTVYHNFRSAFVHGGREIPLAPLIADSQGHPYFPHWPDGRKELAPGLAWFAERVRSALLGYLQSRAEVRPNPELIADLAQQRGVLKLKFKSDVKAGQAILLSDVDLDG